MHDNIFFFRHINKIGGIETFFYYLAKKYQDKDITIYYMSADPEQVKRLSQFVRVRRWHGQHVKCKRAFFNFNLEMLNSVEAEEYYQVAHGDYKAMNLKPNMNKKLTGFIGVSDQVCKTYNEMTGKEVSLCYNPLDVDPPKKVLHLLSATRLTAEKGKARIEQMAKKLDEEGIPYFWTVFSDSGKELSKLPSVAVLEPRLDITNYINKADYLVQLSDNEGYCYSVVEALTLGTPVIVTDVPVFKELGVEDGKNGFILDFNLNNLDPEKIYKGVKSFKYQAPEDSWMDFIIDGKSEYKEEEKELVMVESIVRYYDKEFAEEIPAKRTFEVTRRRAEELVNARVVRIIE